MKNRYKSRTWVAKLWYLADQIDQIGSLIRNANKPSDLVFPLNSLLQIARRIDLFRDEWLLSWLKKRSESPARWPKLWERFL